MVSPWTLQAATPVVAVTETVLWLERHQSTQARISTDLPVPPGPVIKMFRPASKWLKAISWSYDNSGSCEVVAVVVVAAVAMLAAVAAVAVEVEEVKAVEAMEEEEDRVRLEGLGAATGDGTAKRSSCWYFCDAMGDAAAGDRLE